LPKEPPKLKCGRLRIDDRATLTSEASGMPSAAIAPVFVDFMVPLEKIPAALVSLAVVRGGTELFGISASPPAA
jgi:two-component system chemotaxis response regulator CheB